MSTTCPARPGLVWGALGPPSRYKAGRGNVGQTNFIPDVRTAALDDAGHKVSGGQITSFEMGGNSLVGHIAGWPVGRSPRAPSPGSGAVLLILPSTASLLMWPNEAGPRPYQ